MTTEELEKIVSRHEMMWEDYLTKYGATSRKDLAGKSRKTGPMLDIGCYACSGNGFRLMIR